MGCYARTLAFLEHIGVADRVTPPAGSARRDARSRAGARRIACAGCPARCTFGWPAALSPAARAERLSALIAGSPLIVDAGAIRGWRRPSPSCCRARTVGARAQRFWHPVAIATCNESPTAPPPAPSPRCWRAPSSARGATRSSCSRGRAERPLHRRGAALHRGAWRAVSFARASPALDIEEDRVRARATPATAVGSPPTRSSSPCRRARSHRLPAARATRAPLRPSASFGDVADRVGAPLVRPPGAATSRSSACSARRRIWRSIAPALTARTRRRRRPRASAR